MMKNVFAMPSGAEYVVRCIVSKAVLARGIDYVRAANLAIERSFNSDPVFIEHRLLPKALYVQNGYLMNVR